MEFPPPMQPVQQRRKARWVVGILSLMLIAGGGYVAYRQLASSQPQTHQRPPVVPVEHTDLTITVSANGTIEPKQVVNVSPKTAGIVNRLLVEEGDLVTEGQIIAYMDDSDLQGQLTQARGQLAAAEANLQKMLAGNRAEETAQAQARFTSAQANLRQAEDDLSRNQELYTAGAISRQVYNRAVTARDTAQAEVVEVQQALALSQAGYRTEDIAQARAQVESARGVLQTIQTQIEDTIIRAPFGGIVSRTYADPGAFVTPTTAGSSVSSATSSSILSLASTNQVVANVSESNISKIQVGQPVLIEADAYPGKTFQGRVSHIATEATVEQNVTSFEIEVTLLSGAEQLRSGMNVAVEFQVQQLANVMTVPSIAITTQEDVTGVFVGSPNQPPRFVPITTGATVDNRTEVKDGLTGTEHVLLSLPAKPDSQSGFSLPNLFGGSSSNAPPGAPPGGHPGGPPSGVPGGAPSGPPPQ
ncbi:efflux RND transporter periplasmic adaptor subunit [Oscillatoria sp. FACHB-1407]|nr:efflux RND transporter periplasmic adaptor subunit [Oscillatoria sp. FACHB-1407]